MAIWKKKYSELSLRKIYFRKLIFSYMALIFLPVFFVGSILYNYASKIINEETSKSVYDYLEQTSHTIDDIINNAQSVFFQMAFNKMTSELVKKPKGYLSTYEGIKSVWDVIDVYHNLAVSNKYIDSIYIYFDNTKDVITSDNGILSSRIIPFRKWFSDETGVRKQMEWIATKEKDVFGNYDKYYYSFKGYFANTVNPTKDVILLNLNVDNINSKVSQWQIKETGYVVVTDEKGKILFHKEKAFLLGDIGEICDKKAIFNSIKGYYTDIFNGEETMVVYTTIEQLGWKEIAFIPMASITGKIDFMKRTTMIVTLLSIIIAVIFSIYISRRVYKPLETLLYGMKSAETGDLSVRITDNRKDEFGYLYKVFNGMLKKIDELVFDAYKLKLLNKDAELKALQAQINPHFLHNTLNSIYCMAKSYGNRDVSKLIYKLSEYFRLSFGFDGREIEITSEIDHVRLYVDIMAVRYIGKFGIHFNIDEKLYGCKTLKYLIQPLVENSLNHGMKGKRKDFQIKVEGRMEENAVRFQVSDNGAGIGEGKLQSIRICLMEKNVESENFALCNINSRIKLFYGEEYGVDISSRINGGTIVDLVIPVRRL